MLKLINIYSFFWIISIVIIYCSFAAADFQNELDNNFVQHQLINLREFGNGNIPLEQQFRFDQAFEREPQIIFGIVYYNNQDKPAKQGINFHITCEQVNKYNCNLQLHLQDPTNILYGIKVMALAIDSQYIPNIKVSDLRSFFTNDFKKKENLLIHEVKIKYSAEIMRYDVKKVAVFLNGFKTSNYDETKHKQMKIAIEVEQSEKDTFLIKVISNEESIKIEQIYIQYIEYGEDEQSNFFVEIFEEKKFKKESFCNSNQTVCTRKEKKSETIDYQFITKVQNGSYQKILFGINQLDFTLGEHQKILLTVDSFIKQTLNCKYQIQESEAIINGIMSTFIIIGIRKCLGKDLYYKKSCFINCSSRGRNMQYYNINYCGCGFNEYFDNEKNMCLLIPNENQCQMVYFPFNTCKTCKDENCIQCKDEQGSICTKCNDTNFLKEDKCQLKCSISNCKECQQQCTLCEDNYFLYQNICNNQQPDETYCNTKKICMPCKQDGCKICNDPKIGDDFSCTSCKQNYYNYEKKCVTLQPDKTFCDKNNECINCSIQNCKYCGDPNKGEQCEKCIDGYYKYQNQCQEQKPKNTFCDDKKECVKCKIQNCDECEDPQISEKCKETCQDKYFLFQGQCTQVRPKKTFCDEQNICKACRTDDGCLNCTDPDKNDTYKCLECDQDYFHINDSCFKDQPINYFCDKNKKCIKCKEGCDECKESDVICSKCNPDLYLYKNDCLKTQPNNTYCDQTNKHCVECLSKGCKFCQQDIFKCVSCQEGLDLDDKGFCVCKEKGKYYDQNSQTCSSQCSFPCLKCFGGPNFCIECGQGAEFFEKGINDQTCKCKNKEEAINDNNDCFFCPSFLQKTVRDGITFCECLQPEQHFSKIQNKCLDCKFKNCQKCKSDGESCQQCKPGFRINKIKNSLNQCSYCNNGIYANESGACDINNKCKPGCITCTSSEDCQQYKEEYIFKDKDCHYSCSECLSPSQYDCLKCNSETRELKKNKKECPCKQGYKEIQIENQSQTQTINISNTDCILDKDVAYESSTKYTRQNMMNAVYFLYLPQLFVNVHPFGDSFLFSLQILGNASFLTKDRQILEQFSIFNYFNILYSNLDEQAQQKQFKAVFINYKTIIDKDVTSNIGILTVFIIIGLLLTLITYIGRTFFKIYSNLFQQTFLWNFQLKVIRISSNYLILNTAIHLLNITKATIFSNICILSLLIVYIVNFIVCIKKAQQKDTFFIKFMSENLNTDKFFHRYYWIFIEIKKIILVILLVFLNSKFYHYAVIVTSVFSVIIVVYQKPGLNTMRDSTFLILNSLCLIAISSIFIIAEQQLENNEISQVETLRFIIDWIAFIFGLFQYLFCIEYQFRKWRQNRREKQESCNSKLTQAPVFLEIPVTINYENLSEILSQTSAQSTRNKLCSKNKFY